MKKERIGSIDILRGLTIFLMIVVNTGTPNAPWFMQHFPRDQSGMTFVDVIFPAFLLIMGMSIPLSIGRQLDRGVSHLKIIGPVLLRSGSLILLGLLHLGMNKPDVTVMGGSVPMWGTLLYLSFFAVWHSVPIESAWATWISRGVRAAGIGMLLYYICIFSAVGGGWIETKYWGILGVLGWAYLIVTAIYMVFRNQKDMLLLSSFALLSLYIADSEGMFSAEWVNGSLFGGRPAITMMGAAMGVLLIEPLKHDERLRWIAGFTVLTGLIAYFMEPLYGIGKVASTPTWIYASVALTALVWIPVYWLRDMRGIEGGPFRFFTGLGCIPLTVYLFHPLVSYAMKWTGLHDLFWQLGKINLTVGYTRTVLFAILVCWAPIVLFRKKEFLLKL